ncbi:MAG: hypothetical protein ACLUD2_20565 [Clostridium sp.]
MGMPVSVLKEEKIFEKIIAIKYDVPNDRLDMFDDYKKADRRLLQFRHRNATHKEADENGNRISWPSVHSTAPLAVLEGVSGRIL